MSNDLETLKCILRDRLPGARMIEDPPAQPTGSWWLDLHYAPHHAVVEWRPGVGFGLSVPTGETHYGEGPDEVYSDAEETASRLLELLGAVLTGQGRVLLDRVHGTQIVVSTGDKNERRLDEGLRARISEACQRHSLTVPVYAPASIGREASGPAEVLQFSDRGHAHLPQALLAIGDMLRQDGRQPIYSLPALVLLTKHRLEARIGKSLEFEECQDLTGNKSSQYSFDLYELRWTDQTGAHYICFVDSGGSIKACLKYTWSASVETISIEDAA